jgi:hypothetical protein
MAANYIRELRAELQSPALQMLAQDPILLLQVVNCVSLAPVDPTSEQQEQELERTALRGAERSVESPHFARSSFRHDGMAITDEFFFAA